MIRSIIRLFLYSPSGLFGNLVYSGENSRKIVTAGMRPFPGQFKVHALKNEEHPWRRE
jgi:hypothetical protein